MHAIDGGKAFASYREPAWHNLGTVFHDEVTNAREMLKRAHLLDWNVRLEKVEIPGVKFPKEYFATVRDNPFTGEKDGLGIVGKRYACYQNENLGEFSEYLVSGGARYETAGAVHSGTKVFLSLAMERETVLDPSGVADTVKSYLLLSTSHDGSAAISANITPVRVVCANTLDFALAGASQSFRVKHTMGHKGKIAAARNALGLVDTYWTAFDEDARAFFAQEVNDRKFNDIVLAAFPKPEEGTTAQDKRRATMWEAKIDAVWDYYRGEANHMIQGSAWGALNALTEANDYGRKVYNEDTEAFFRAASGMDAASKAERNRLRDVVKEVAFN